MYDANVLLFFLATSAVGAILSNTCTNRSNLNVTIKDVGDSHRLIEIELENIFKSNCRYFWTEVCDLTSVMTELKQKLISEREFIYFSDISKPTLDNLQIFVWCKSNNNLTFVGMWNRNSTETPTKSIYVPVSVAVCSLIGFLIFVFVTIKLIRCQRTNQVVPGQRKKSWCMRCMQRKTNAKVFGVSLIEICQRENSVVPFIVKDICNYILENHVSLEGIFRISAPSDETGNLRQAYEDYALDFEENANVCAELRVDAYVASDVLKQFFRHLSEPLIPDEVLNVSQETICLSDEIFASRVRSLMEAWPEQHRQTLKYLLNFFGPVLRNEENRMNIRGLAVVFGPNLFRIPTDMRGLEIQTLANSTFERLLRTSDVLCDHVQVATYDGTSVEINQSQL